MTLCSECGQNQTENQKSISGHVSRRGECNDCRKSKKPISQKKKNEYQKKNPPPQIGDIFICPICDTIFERQFTNDVVLDHNHKTGEVRGYICRMCNSGMGMMDDNPTILQRAIGWLKGTLLNL